MGEDNWWFVIGLSIFLGILCFVIVVSGITDFIEVRHWQYLAIYHHAAHYDAKTGNFTWN
jgi:hypothetical protein